MHIQNTNKYKYSFTLEIGMFTFFKRLLKQVPQEREQDLEFTRVYLEEAERWLTDNSIQGNDGATGKDVLQTVSSDLQSEVLMCQKNLAVLEQTDLRNSNISLKEKQMMEAHRSNYLQRTRSFVDSLSSLGSDASSLKPFCERYDAEIAAYTEGTAKAFHVLQYFFAHESQAVSSNIKQIDEHLRKLKTLFDANDVELIATARGSLSQIKERILQRDYLQLKLQELEEQKKKEIENRDTYALKLEKLKKNEKFTQYQTFLEQRDELTKQIREHSLKLEYVFSVLEKSLLKLFRNKPEEKIVKKFLLDPVTALLEDGELQLLPLLTQLKDAVDRDALDLREDRKVKTLKALSALQKDKLASFKNLLQELRTKKSEYDRGMRGSMLIQDYNDLKYKYDHYDDRIKKHDFNVKQVEEKLKEIALDDLKKSAEEQLSRCTKKSVELVLMKKNPDVTVVETAEDVDEVAPSAAEEVSERDRRDRLERKSKGPVPVRTASRADDEESVEEISFSDNLVGSSQKELDESSQNPNSPLLELDIEEIDKQTK